MKFTFDLNQQDSERLVAYIGDRFKSEVIRDIILEKLALAEGDQHTSSLDSLVKHPDMLDEYFTCPETRDSAKYRDLPCIEEMLDHPLWKCRNPICFKAVKETLGIA